MRAPAGPDRHERRRQLLEGADHLGSQNLTTHDHDLVFINAVGLEDRLGSVHADADGWFTGFSSRSVRRPSVMTLG